MSSMKTIILAALILLGQAAQPARAQNASYQQLDQMLNAAFPGTNSGSSLNQSQGSSGNFNQSSNFGSAAPMPSQYSPQFQAAPVSSRPFLNQGTGLQQAQAGPLGWFRQAMRYVVGNQQPQQQWPDQQTQAAAQNGNQGRGSFFQTMFGGDSSQDASGNASRAQTQASIAHNAYNNSFYGDHYSRCQCADRAYYAAQEARREADAAYAKVQAGVPNAQNYAYTARAAAQAAEADYYGAKANADASY